MSRCKRKLLRFGSILVAMYLMAVIPGCAKGDPAILEIPGSLRCAPRRYDSGGAFMSRQHILLRLAAITMEKRPSWEQVSNSIVIQRRGA